MIVLPEWPCSQGVAVNTGLIRSCPEDFVVEEIPRISPEGEGGHLWLWVEKRGANTDWVAHELATVAACAVRDVGYAGMKDRHAVTRQWFSVPFSTEGQENLARAQIEDVNILASSKHGKKLKRGTLSGNRFQLKIRQLQGDSGQLQQRLQHIREYGVPNYFGPQRFGHGGRNVQQGLSLLQKRARLNRNKRSIYLSAIRSFLFNHLLAERVRRGNWNTISDGELVMLNGTRSVFPCEKPDQEIEERCMRLDIHPTGPMPGEGGTQPGGKAFELEQEILATWPALTEVLVGQRVQASRRALRLYPEDFAWNLVDENLEISFILPPGTYATTILREFLSENHESVQT